MSDNVELPLEETPLDKPCHGTATYEENNGVYCSLCGALLLELPPVDETPDE